MSENHKRRAFLTGAPADADRPAGRHLFRGAALNKMMFDLLLARVKTPDASRYPWDYLDVVARIPAGDAFRPVAESGCALAT